ncbi:MAG: GAF domain-containing protein [candidate division Zixibacteria bacterium]
MNTLEIKEEVSNFWSKIELVAEISKILRDKPTSRKSLLKILDLIAQIIPFDSATMYLFNKVQNELKEVATRGKTVNVLDFLQFGQGMGLAGWAAKQKQPLYIPGREPGIDHVRKHHDGILILPLLMDDELVGVLCFSDSTSKSFNTNRRRFLEIVTDQIAVSLERLNYLKQLEQKNLYLEQTQTRLKEAQAQLIAQEKLKAVSELAISVNHEVNNPLSTIVGNAQIIELESADLPEKITKRVNAIVDGARQISLITHKLMKIDRLVSEQYTRNNKETMLNLDKSSGIE